MEKKNEIEKIGGGLLPDTKDARDFSLGGVFGIIQAADVPNEDFIVAIPLVIKDQGSSDLCTAYAATAVSEDQEGIELSPEYLFAQTKKIVGSWQGWGADLRTTCKALLGIGAVKKADAPFSLQDHVRDFVANWNNWPDLSAKAAEHKKEAFFQVDGPHDAFDNIRAAMWQFKDEKRSIYTGCMWRKEWTRAPGGIISSNKFQKAYGHAFKIFGQKMIMNTPYLMAQLSNGTDIGDNGIFYFSRAVVNAEFYTAYMFKDIASIPPQKMVELLKVESKQQQPWLTRFIDLIKELFIKNT